MAVRIYQDSNGNYRKNNDIIPAGNYRLIYNSDQSQVGIIGGTNYFKLLPLMPLSEVQDESGTAYATVADLEAALVDFFNVGGSGRGRSINPDHLFADSTARDTYFSTNQNELRQAQTEIILLDTSTIQLWVGQDRPTTYSATNNWLSEGTLPTAAQIKSLYESNADTNAFTDAYKTILDFITNTTDELQFSKAIYAPSFRSDPGGSYEVGNLDIDTAGITIGAVNLATNSRGFALVQRYTDSGSIRPSFYTFGTAQDLTLQSDSSTIQPTAGSSYTFTTPASPSLLFWQAIKVIPAEVGEFSYEIRFTNANGQLLSIQGPITFTQDQVDNQTEVTMRFDNNNNIFTEANTQLHITLKGAKLRGGTNADGDFQNYSIGVVHHVTEENFPIQTDLNTKEDALGNPASNGQILSSQTDGTRSWIDAPTGTGGTDADAIHDNVQGEISAISEKTDPVNADLLLIEDSEDSNNKKRIQIGNLPGVQSYHAPILQNLAVNIASRVDLNTDLNVQHTFTFDSHNSANLTALTLIVTTGDDKTITLPINDGANSLDITLSGIDSSSESTLTLQLSGTDTQTNTITSNTITINIRNQVQHAAEVYLDVTADNLASSVDAATAVMSDELNPTLTVETFTGNSYIQILQQNTRSRFNSINIGGLNQIGAFTINDNAVTINTVSYRQYVTTNLITDSLSGETIILGGAS